MKYDNQLRYAVSIIREYDGNMPLSGWLKNFYKVNKQMGSRDRKTVSEMVYGFYRLGHNHFNSLEERIITAIGLTGQIPEISEYFNTRIPPYFPKKTTEELVKDDRSPNGNFSNLLIFPWLHLLSDNIDRNAFSHSFLIQPDLFLRIRPGNKEKVFSKLIQANIPFTECGNDCISLANTTRINDLIQLDREAVIQDKSSQRTGSLIKEGIDNIRATGTPEVWDCCAASGGKSIMAWDLAGSVNLTVSDKRKSIITNLRTRLNQAGIEQYNLFEADLANQAILLPEKHYDLIIADVPCSGSGTWARTPEQLYFFKEERIGYYQQLQQTIVSRVIQSLNKNGYFLYITCSVFYKENEAVVNYIQEKLGLTLLNKQLFAGYNDKADTLFAAMFTN